MSAFGELAIPDVNNAHDSDIHPLALSPVNVPVAAATESPSTNLIGNGAVSLFLYIWLHLS